MTLVNYLQQPVRYAAVGLATFLIFAGVSATLLKYTNWNEGIITGISIGIAGLINFLGQAYFTFKTQRSAVSMAPGYVAVLALNAVIAGLVVSVAIERFDASVTVANALALVLVTISSFVLMKYAVMPSKKAEKR